MNELIQITPQQMEVIHEKGCWSVENMAAHGAEGSKLEYIASHVREPYLDGAAPVREYYKDEAGRFWYQNKMRLPGGRIITMEKYMKIKRPR